MDTKKFPNCIIAIKIKFWSFHLPKSSYILFIYTINWIETPFRKKASTPVLQNFYLNDIITKNNKLHSS